MILDWLAHEGWIVASWWLLISAAGLTMMPLLARLLRGLPDHGYTLARPVGLLLITYTFWLLATLGFVDNTVGSILFAWGIVLVVSLGVYVGAAKPVRQALSWRAWWQENRTVVVVGEVLFIVLLVGWAIFRAYQNELVSTEKPMDLAFMSAIQHSITFPPADPWLSGHVISYYYFGYTMAAVMATLAGVSSTIGYSMHIALVFALAGTAAFGVAYNLVRSLAAHRVQEDISTQDSKSRTPALTAGILAAFFLVLMGNYQLPLVELPYQTRIASNEYLQFWDVNQRREVRPEGSPTELKRWSYWWWFRGARVISDKGLDGGHIEVIAEFPQFSYILADSHPHVMGLPFSLLAMGMALNILLMKRRPRTDEILFYGLCVGGLVFLNTWDSPIYIALLVGAEALRRLMRQGVIPLRDWGYLAAFGLTLLAITIAAYLPFLIGFRSQAGGLLPNLINPTHTPQLFLKFGPFILMLGVFLGVETWRAHRIGRMHWALGFKVIAGILFGLLAGMLVFTLAGWLSQATRASVLGYIDANGGWSEVLPAILGRRLVTILTPLLLLLAVLLVIARLFPNLSINGTDRNNPVSYSLATGFALLLVGAGVTLVLFPEFLYLRDNFGTRMNTVFKFYYQAWAMFSIASAYAVYSILMARRVARPPVPVRVVLGAVIVLAIVLGSLNPILGTYTRMLVETGHADGLNSDPLTLDGGPAFTSRDDYVVIMCLADLVGRQDAVVAEANPQGPNTNYNPNHARVGSLTGIPVVMGWPGHQSQWRGPGYMDAVGSRPQDLDYLYTELRFDRVTSILDRYEIDYVLYGATERNHYGSAGEDKFVENLEVVCESGTSRVYRVNPRRVQFTGR